MTLILLFALFLIAKTVVEDIFVLGYNTGFADCTMDVTDAFNSNRG